MDAGDYARAVFPLGPGLVGLCVTLSSAAAASSATPVAPLTFDNAVLDPRYEPAGDVAVKLALQVCVALIGADYRMLDVLVCLTDVVAGFFCGTEDACTISSEM